MRDMLIIIDNVSNGHCLVYRSKVERGGIKKKINAKAMKRL